MGNTDADPDGSPDAADGDLNDTDEIDDHDGSPDAENDPGDADEDTQLPLGETCDPLEENSCPEGQRCGLNRSSLEPMCSYITADDASHGESCVVTAQGDNCGDGMTCIQASSTMTFCANLCHPTEYEGCTRAESCNIPISDDYTGCSPSCDLITNEGCPSGTNCGVFADTSGAVFKDCDTAGTLVHGDSCDSGNRCAAGHMCAYWSVPPWSSGWECLQLCDRDGIDGPACPDGTTCGYPPDEAEPFATIDGVGACR